MAYDLTAMRGRYVMCSCENGPSHKASPRCGNSRGHGPQDVTLMSNTESTVPYGYCQCGCGERAAIATQTDNANGVTKGKPRQYARGHQRRGPAADRLARIAEYRSAWTAAGIPYGRCLCGCGATTAPWCETDFKTGRIAGEHRKWLANGHAQALSPNEYRREDRGHDTMCWVWLRSINAGGYGVAGGSGLAHRVVYERVAGPIPDGLHLDHLCRVRACVNPDHLEPVSQTENNRRQINQKLTMGDARAIRSSFQSWSGSKWAFCKRAASDYGVHPSTVDSLLLGHSWKEATDGV